MGEKKERKAKKEKALEDWTIKELREEALKVPNVQGIHGMNKHEIIEFLRQEKGLPPSSTKKNSEGVRVFKGKVNQLREKLNQERNEGASRNRLAILRRKVSRMKKKTRHI
ncbi:MAG: transcription termination factor Rho [Deltaproteobacteria bacterium]|nr:transcription termination factor Rho [Deltaproteobacteria bacterium]